MSQEPTRLEMVSVDAKPFWHSKTFWTQVIGITLLVLSYAIDPEANLGLSAQVVSIIRLVMIALQGALTIYFRSGATEGLDLRGAQRDVAAHVHVPPQAPP